MQRRKAPCSARPPTGREERHALGRAGGSASELTPDAGTAGEHDRVGVDQAERGQRVVARRPAPSSATAPVVSRAGLQVARETARPRAAGDRRRSREDAREHVRRIPVPSSPATVAESLPPNRLRSSWPSWTFEELRRPPQRTTLLRFRWARVGDVEARSTLPTATPRPRAQRWRATSRRTAGPGESARRASTPAPADRRRRARGRADHQHKRRPAAPSGSRSDARPRRSTAAPAASPPRPPPGPRPGHSGAGSPRRAQDIATAVEYVTATNTTRGKIQGNMVESRTRPEYAGPGA